VPEPASKTSWRNAPQPAVIHQALGWLMLGAILTVCFGLLLGATWTTQALQPKLQQQAEERRRLNQAWAAVRAARHQVITCPRCGCPLNARYWYRTQESEQDPPEDD
jgi:uncharacterized paraquat-inducible protein A